eukprot:TRINITY_DN3992_c0_g1_i4.p1 TRINITY_DN3992_c0_g1~~TRINITY_DN3992_c0_g1_i4.p1  ORF type:complete len:3758 (+),score=598.66 TRINITY_DN3992_c0_g1_i4:1100-11275(+)
MPSTAPSRAPSAVSPVPTRSPTSLPSRGPTTEPTSGPSRPPTSPPSTSPSSAPTKPPTRSPSVPPSAAPSAAPSLTPTHNPSGTPSAAPSVTPTGGPTTVWSFPPHVFGTVVKLPLGTAAASLQCDIAAVCGVACENAHLELDGRSGSFRVIDPEGGAGLPDMFAKLVMATLAQTSSLRVGYPSAEWTVARPITPIIFKVRGLSNSPEDTETLRGRLTALLKQHAFEPPPSSIDIRRSHPVHIVTLFPSQWPTHVSVDDVTHQLLLLTDEWAPAVIAAVFPIVGEGFDTNVLRGVLNQPLGRKARQTQLAQDLPTPLQVSKALSDTYAEHLSVPKGTVSVDGLDESGAFQVRVLLPPQTDALAFGRAIRNGAAEPAALLVETGVVPPDTEITVSSVVIAFQLDGLPPGWQVTDDALTTIGGELERKVLLTDWCENFWVDCGWAVGVSFDETESKFLVSFAVPSKASAPEWQPGVDLPDTAAAVAETADPGWTPSVQITQSVQPQPALLLVTHPAACEGDPLRLFAGQPIVGSGQWTPSSYNYQPSASSPTADVGVLPVGEYDFAWTVGEVSLPLVAAVVKKPIPVIVSAPQTVDVASGVDIEAEPAGPNTRGRWRASSRAVVFEDATQHKTRILSLDPGLNNIVWELSVVKPVGVCSAQHAVAKIFFQCSGDTSCDPQHSDGCKQGTGECICHRDFSNGFWGGASCQRCCTVADGCPADFFGSDCSTRCSSAETCRGHGACNSEGGCDCFSHVLLGHWSGPSCSECDSSKGKFGDPAGGCVECLPGWFPSGACDVPCSFDTCFGNGKCTSVGQCECASDDEAGFWTGERCDVCAGEYLPPSCTGLPAADEVRCPVEVTAELGPSRSVVFVSFSKPTDGAAVSAGGCSALLAPTVVEHIGTESQCIFPNATFMELKLGESSEALEAGFELVFIRTLRAASEAGTPTCSPFAAHVVVKAARDVPPPHVTLTGPDTVGPCVPAFATAGVRVSTSKYTLQWDVTSTGGDANVVAAAVAAAEGRITLELPSAGIGQAAKVNVRVTDAAGGEGSAQLAISRVAEAVPHVEPLVSKDLELDFSSPATLRVQVRQYNCDEVDFPVPELEWSSPSHPGVVSGTDTVLNIPAWTLRTVRDTDGVPVPYLIVCTEKRGSSVQFTVRPRELPPLATILGGDREELSIWRSVEVAARIQDRMNTGEAPTLQWSCKTDTGGSCAETPTALGILLDPASMGVQPGGSVSIFLTATVGELTSERVSATYRFSDNTLAVLDVVIDVFSAPGTVPLVARRRVGSFGAAPTVKWTCTTGNLDLTNPRVSRNGDSQPTLLINAAALLPRAVYDIAVRVEAPGALGTAKHQLRARLTPSGGSLRVDPLIAVAPEQRISLRAAGWVSAVGGDLEFQFKAEDAHGRRRTLAEWGLSSEVDFVPPVPLELGESLPMLFVVEVRDREGAISEMRAGGLVVGADGVSPKARSGLTSPSELNNVATARLSLIRRDCYSECGGAIRDGLQGLQSARTPGQRSQLAHIYEQGLGSLGGGGFTDDEKEATDRLVDLAFSVVDKNEGAAFDARSASSLSTDIVYQVHKLDVDEASSVAEATGRIVGKLADDDATDRSAVQQLWGKCRYLIEAVQFALMDGDVAGVGKEVLSPTSDLDMVCNRVNPLQRAKVAPGWAGRNGVGGMEFDHLPTDGDDEDADFDICATQWPRLPSSSDEHRAAAGEGGLHSRMYSYRVGTRGKVLKPTNNRFAFQIPRTVFANATNTTGNTTKVIGKGGVPVDPSVCVWWNHTNSSWSTSGCNATWDATTLLVTCTCSHLTDFSLVTRSVGSQFAVQPEVLIQRLAQLKLNPAEAKLASVIFVVVVSLCGVVVLRVASTVAQKQHRRELEADLDADEALARGVQRGTWSGGGYPVTLLEAWSRPRCQLRLSPRARMARGSAYFRMWFSRQVHRIGAEHPWIRPFISTAGNFDAPRRMAVLFAMVSGLLVVNAALFQSFFARTTVSTKALFFLATILCSALVVRIVSPIVSYLLMRSERTVPNDLRLRRISVDFMLRGYVGRWWEADVPKRSSSDSNGSPTGCTELLSASYQSRSPTADDPLRQAQDILHVYDVDDDSVLRIEEFNDLLSDMFSDEMSQSGRWSAGAFQAMLRDLSQPDDGGLDAEGLLHFYQFPGSPAFGLLRDHHALLLTVNWTDPATGDPVHITQTGIQGCVGVGADAGARLFAQRIEMSSDGNSVRLQPLDITYGLPFAAKPLLTRRLRFLATATRVPHNVPWVTRHCDMTSDTRSFPAATSSSFLKESPGHIAEEAVLDMDFDATRATTHYCETEDGSEGEDLPPPADALERTRRDKDTSSLSQGTCSGRKVRFDEAADDTTDVASQRSDELDARQRADSCISAGLFRAGSQRKLLDSSFRKSSSRGGSFRGKEQLAGLVAEAVEEDDQDPLAPWAQLEHVRSGVQLSQYERGEVCRGEVMSDRALCAVAVAINLALRYGRVPASIDCGDSSTERTTNSLEAWIPRRANEPLGLILGKEFDFLGTMDGSAAQRVRLDRNFMHYRLTHVNGKEISLPVLRKVDAVGGPVTLRFAMRPLRLNDVVTLREHADTNGPLKPGKRGVVMELSSVRKRSVLVQREVGGQAYRQWYDPADLQIVHGQCSDSERIDVAELAELSSGFKFLKDFSTRAAYDFASADDVTVDRVIDEMLRDARDTARAVDWVQRHLWQQDVNKAAWRVGVELVIQKRFALAAAVFETVPLLLNPDLFFVLHPTVHSELTLAGVVGRVAADPYIGRVWVSHYARRHLGVGPWCRCGWRFPGETARTAGGFVTAVLGLQDCHAAVPRFGGASFHLAVEDELACNWDDVEMLVAEKRLLEAAHVARIVRKRTPQLNHEALDHIHCGADNAEAPLRILKSVSKVIDESTVGRLSCDSRRVRSMPYTGFYPRTSRVKNGCLDRLAHSLLSLFVGEEPDQSNFYSTLEYSKLLILTMAEKRLRMPVHVCTVFMLQQERLAISQRERLSLRFSSVEPLAAPMGGERRPQQAGSLETTTGLPNNNCGPPDFFLSNPYLTPMLCTRLRNGGMTRGEDLSSAAAQPGTLRYVVPNTEYVVSKDDYNEPSVWQKLPFSQLGRFLFPAAGSGLEINPHRGLQAAVADARLGDTLMLLPGTYNPCSLKRVRGTLQQPLLVIGAGGEKSYVDSGDGAASKLQVASSLLRRKSDAGAVQRLMDREAEAATFHGSIESPDILRLVTCRYVQFVNVRFRGTEANVAVNMRTSSDVYVTECVFLGQARPFEVASDNAPQLQKYMQQNMFDCVRAPSFASQVLQDVNNATYPSWMAWTGYFIALLIYVAFMALSLFISAGYTDYEVVEWAVRAVASILVDVFVLQPLLIVTRTAIEEHCRGAPPLQDAVY